MNFDDASLVEQRKERHRALTRAWRLKNLERERERVRKYCQEAYAKNPERRKADKAKYYLRNKEHVKSKLANYYQQHRKELTEKARLQHLKNPEAHRARAMQWYELHKNDPEYKRRRSVRHREHYMQNKAAIIKKHKTWRKNNPGVMSALKAKRRLLQENATINLGQIKRWMNGVKSKPSAVCYFCNRVTARKDIHFDHIVPLSKGGAHAIENLCVSCASCNLSKQAKSVQAWVRVGQQIMAL